MGDIYNTVTSQYWDGEKGINVVPCYQTTKYLEFTPRDQGGGFKGEISPTDPVLQKQKDKEAVKSYRIRMRLFVLTRLIALLLMKMDHGNQP